MTSVIEAFSVDAFTPGMSNDSNWDNFARMQASERWRANSAAMGKPATEALVGEADIRPGMHVLDIASGTGEPAISIASKLSGTGRVIATDISSNPLEIAKQRAAQRGLENIEFQQADAHSLPFEDRSFDRVTSRLGIMFFANPSQAFAEIYRVLRPGGKFSFLAWGPYEQPYFAATIATVLKALPGTELPASGWKMFRYGAPNLITADLRDVGFSDIEARIQSVPWTWNGTAEDVWAYFQDVTIPFQQLFAAIPATRRTEIDRAVVDAIGQYRCDGRIEFGAKFVIGSAIR